MIFSKSIAYISSLCIHSIYCIMFSSQSLTIPELANTSRASSVLLYTTDSASSVRLAGRKNAVSRHPPAILSVLPYELRSSRALHTIH